MEKHSLYRHVERSRNIFFIVEDVVHDYSRVQTSEAGLHPFDSLR